MAVTSNTILVPVDFSEQSLIALGQSYNLARLSRAGITLIYCIEDAQLLNRGGTQAERKMNLLSMVKELKGKLEKLAKDTSEKAGVRVNTEIVHGKVYEEICNYAARKKSKMIIMGATGSPGGFKRFVGSNTLRILRQAPCPVITIRGKKHRSGCKHILLPIDLQKETKEKVSKAIEFANYFGSTIDILSVITMDDDFIINKLKRQIQQVKEYIEHQEVHCTVEVLQGKDVVDEILNYAKKINADLIMIMTQGEVNWTKFFIGWAAQEVINRSEIPVLSINPSLKKNLIRPLH